ncbi:MAG: DUF523 domain-containing protein [Deltaproteobacteria bacterium]|nr:DUF523 domain-containing protein [Deltaproteobacteria bacterium]
MILVSACLVGINCRFDGTNKLNEKVLNFCQNKGFIPICPEQLGGLSTPRIPAEIVSGDGNDVLKGMSRVINERGEDVTEIFIRGGKKTFKIIELMKISKVIFKDMSPSCGVHWIYHNGELKSGVGVTTSIVKEAGIQVVAEADL